jgi:hypothetical protein
MMFAFSFSDNAPRWFYELIIARLKYGNHVNPSINLR